MSKSVLVEIVKLNNALLLRLNSDFLTFFSQTKYGIPSLEVWFWPCQLKSDQYKSSLGRLLLPSAGYLDLTS